MQSRENRRQNEQIERQREREERLEEGMEQQREQMEQQREQIEELLRREREGRGADEGDPPRSSEKGGAQAGTK